MDWKNSHFVLDADRHRCRKRKKTHGRCKLEPVTIVPIKRLCIRLFIFASEEAKSIFWSHLMKGLHSSFAVLISWPSTVNPRTKQESNCYWGCNCFWQVVTRQCSFTTSDPDFNVEDAVKMIQGAISSGYWHYICSAPASMKNSATLNQRLGSKSIHSDKYYRASWSNVGTNKTLLLLVTCLTWLNGG